MTPAFSAAMARQGGTQEFHMVEVDVGNQGHARVGYVGGVQPAAHADFQHHELRSRMGKVLERGSRQELKKARGFLQVFQADQALDGGGHAR